MKRKVCVVTGTRAEFGLLRHLMQELVQQPDLQLQVIATGTHFSTEHGNTYQEIIQAGFVIDHRVDMLLSADSAAAVTKSTGLAMIGFADAFAQLHPDIIVLLGDRYELLAAASAALLAGIPVAHLHGGETTEGAVDEAIRHAVSKMAHLHFVGAEPYRKRVIQLGESPDRVFCVGGLGVDAIQRLPLLDKTRLEESLGFKFLRKNLLVTFHPVTLEADSSEAQMAALLTALAECTDTRFIFTLPNADTGGKALAAQLHQFAAQHDNAHVFASLGQLRYLSCLQFVDAVVGNSSSGLAEAPSFKIGTIDIGDRQKGRLRAASVLHCAPEAAAITACIKRLYSLEFKAQCLSAINPYGMGGAAERIIQVLAQYQLTNILKKSFHDLEFSP